MTPARVEGPRFQVRTWREGGAWHATVTTIDPIAAPHQDDRRWTTDDDPAGADRPELAIRRAVARFLDIHGERCHCRHCDELEGRCVGRCACRGTQRIVAR